MGCGEGDRLRGNCLAARLGRGAIRWPARRSDANSFAAAASLPVGLAAFAAAAALAAAAAVALQDEE